MLRRLFITLLLFLVGNAVHAEVLYRYIYVLKENHDPKVCGRMLDVFNQKFAHLWDYAPVHWTKNSAEYEFPALPGQSPNAESNYRVWYSAFPTSPEFSAINWRRGFAVLGGCPIGKTCPGEGPELILAAHFDFDNDGSKDTVIKTGTFFQGYDAMFVAEEHLIVWRGQTLAITETSLLWNLEHPKDNKLSAIIISGMYLRPFIYQDTTYVARYVPYFTEGHDQESGPPPYPSREDMLIERYHFSGLKDDITGRPNWATNTICDLRMKRLNNR
jgi:hypothetical protein